MWPDLQARRIDDVPVHHRKASSVMLKVALTSVVLSMEQSPMYVTEFDTSDTLYGCRISTTHL